MKSFINANEKVRENILEYVRGLPIGYSVEFKEKTKTSPQERYFHGILGDIEQQTGNLKEDMKDEIKARVIGFDEKEINGKWYIRPKSSKNVSAEVYGRMIDAALIMADFLKVSIKPRSYYGLE